MLVAKLDHKVYADALRSRIDHLCYVFEGRAAEPKDNRHGLTRGSYAPEHMEHFRIVDKLQLALAIADFSAILTQLNRLK